MTNSKTFLQWVKILFMASFLGLSAAPLQETEISVSVTVPDAGWNITIEQVVQIGEEFWVLSRLQRRPVMSAQVISIAADKVRVPSPLLPIKHFILGKTWRWENKEPHTFIKDKKEIESWIKSGKLLFKSDLVHTLP